MSIQFKYTGLLVGALCCVFAARTQQLSFKHLGVEEGMPSNVTSYACFDSTGLLWISTNDGLISYDGIRIKQYLKETHPGLPVNDIGYLFCDSRNRIWICTNDGLALLDEQRRIKRITISDTLKNRGINYCFEVAGLGIIATDNRSSYLLRENQKEWEPYTWFDNAIRKGKGISSLRKFDKESHFFITDKRVLLVNFVSQKIITDAAINNAGNVSKLNSNELLVADADSFMLYRLSIARSVVTKKYTSIKDTDGDAINTDIYSIESAANGILYISTRSAGLIGFDPDTEKFYSYRHQPLNRNSISTDNLRRVYCHPNGYMMVSSIAGMNYTNVVTPMLQQLTNFLDQHGKITDGVSVAAEDAEGRIWFRSFDNLLIWDRLKNTIRNISPAQLTPRTVETTPGLGGIYRDNKNNMWVAYGSKGLLKFDGNGRLLHSLTRQNNKIPTNRVRMLRQLSSQMLLVATDEGLFMINPETLATDTLSDHPLLKPIIKKRIIDIFPDGDNVWIAVSPNGAAYCYNFNTKKLKTITVKNGLSSDRVYCFGKDRYNNIYIGTYDGLNILSPDGKITVINKENGLRHPRVETIVPDKQGRLWITNFNCLICYNPADKSFTYFDEQNGVNNAGFAVGQGILAKDDKIIFCNNGLLIVDPKLGVTQKEFIPQVSINRLYDDGGYDLLKPSSLIQLNYNEAKVTLYYLTNTLITANRFFYRYKMDGLDTGWQQPTKNNQVTYNLNPGKYTFHIQASSNDGNWQKTANAVTIIVLPPWWQTWMFRIIAASLVAVVLYLIYRNRIKAIKTKAAIKQQMAELEGKALRAQMNPHFIFNSLNAIQELIVTSNIDEAYQYLSNFSKLLRQVLNNSEKDIIPLSAEIEMISLQLSLESLRFNKSFCYYIEVEKEVETELISIPPLLLQPYVENAIWHGLRHKEGEKNLWIIVKEEGKALKIEIKDDGVGRERAAEIKKQKLGAGQFESKGTFLSQERIKILNQLYPGGATVEITDLKNDRGETAGTKISISLPNHLS